MELTNSHSTSDMPLPRFWYFPGNTDASNNPIPRDLNKTGIIRQVGVGIVASPNPEVQLSPDVWFTQEVVVTGRRIRVLINNVLRNDYRMNDPPDPVHLGIILADEAATKIRKIELPH